MELPKYSVSLEPYIWVFLNFNKVWVETKNYILEVENNCMTKRKSKMLSYMSYRFTGSFQYFCHSHQSQCFWQYLRTPLKFPIVSNKILQQSTFPEFQSDDVIKNSE